MSPSLKLSGSWYRLGCDYFAAWWKIAGNDKPRALRNDHARDITHGLLRFTDYFRTVHRNHQASASLRFTSPARARARRGRGGTRGGNGEEKRVKWTTDRVHLFTSDRWWISIVICQWNASRSEFSGFRQICLVDTTVYSQILLHEYYSRAITRTTATFDLPARRVRTSWVTRFQLSAIWNEVLALSQAASRVRSDLNIATCLRRRSRKVWGERNGHFEAPTMDRLRWRYRTNLRSTCVLPA